MSMLARLVGQMHSLGITKPKRKFASCNPRNLRSTFSTFVEIDEVRNALNVVAIGDSHLLFSLFEPRRDRIAPSELRCESVPDKQVAIVKPTPFFEAPLENFFVCAAFQHTIPKIAIMDAQKI